MDLMQLQPILRCALTISTILFSVLVFCGCPSYVYHEMDYIDQRFAKGHGKVVIDPVDYLTDCRGDLNCLERQGAKEEIKRFYSQFNSDTTAHYYSLYIDYVSYIYDPTSWRSDGTYERRFDLKIDSLYIDFGRYGVGYSTDSLLCRPLLIGGMHALSVGPIVIPDSIKKAIITFDFLVTKVADSSIVEQTKISVLSKRHRLVRTILNPWP